VSDRSHTAVPGNARGFLTKSWPEKIAKLNVALARAGGVGDFSNGPIAYNIWQKFEIVQFITTALKSIPNIYSRIAKFGCEML
jgi:hypothetical protein